VLFLFGQRRGSLCHISFFVLVVVRSVSLVRVCVFGCFGDASYLLHSRYAFVVDFCFAMRAGQYNPRASSSRRLVFVVVGSLSYKSIYKCSISPLCFVWGICMSGSSGCVNGLFFAFWMGRFDFLLFLSPRRFVGVLELYVDFGSVVVPRVCFWWALYVAVFFWCNLIGFVFFGFDVGLKWY